MCSCVLAVSLLVRQYDVINRADGGAVQLAPRVWPDMLQEHGAWGGTNSQNISLKQQTRLKLRGGRGGAVAGGMGGAPLAGAALWGS